METDKGYQQAWTTVDTLVNRCKEQYAERVTAIILTGGLARGSYQPGLSDVNLITVLDDSSPDSVRADISGIYSQVGRDHSIQLEPIILKYADFWPPWNDDLRVQPELLRLKASARVLYGQNIIECLPTPTKGQMWKFHHSFRKWLLKSEQPGWQYWTLRESLKMVTEQAMSYFYYRTGIVEHNLHHIADLFSDHYPHFRHLSTLKLASYNWRQYPCGADEELRVQMAEEARDVYNHVTLALGFGEQYLIH